MIKEENKNEFVNVKTKIVRYSKPKKPQWKTKTKPSSSLQPIYEYGTIYMTIHKILRKP